MTRTQGELDHERERTLREMVKAARRLQADKEARQEMVATAEEFLPLENEALEIAEGTSEDLEPWWG